MFRSQEELSIKKIERSLPPLTTGIMVVSAILWLWSDFGRDVYSLKSLFLTEYFPDSGMVTALSGEYWRFVTPIFLHFGIFHIVFNMLWLWQLGGLFEIRMSRETSRFTRNEFGLFILVVGTLSNLAQYYYQPAYLFGGMSGVVYALLGYFWIQGRFNPSFGLELRRPIVVMMLIWFVICWLGLVGNIANMAHTAGLVLGIGWGFASARARHP